MIRVVHTAELTEAELAATRSLLEEAFAGDLSDDDWDHGLGGVHALVMEGDRVVAHGALVLRRLLHRGRALRAGYVEVVAVASDRRRQGLGSLVMEALERHAEGYDLLALSASEDGIGLYQARGWQPWRGPTAALTPDGLRRTPDDDGSVYVLPGRAALDLEAELACDWRDGDVW